MEPLKPIYVGLDIGQIHDPTAIVVTELSLAYRGNMRMVGRQPAPYTVRGRRPAEDILEPLIEAEYFVHHVERLPLGTNYPTVAKRVAAILGSELLRERSRTLLVDVTGVGRPVFEMIEQEVRSSGKTYDVHLLPITFTSGDRYDQITGSLGKAYLVSRLQALLQRGAVHAPDTAEVAAMLEELRVYEIKIDQDGKDTYGAFKVGKHDDLATALGLSVLLGDEQGLERLDEATAQLIRNYRGY